MVAPADPAALVRAAKAREPPPVYAVLYYENGETREVMGFAQGWTQAHVLVALPWPMDYCEDRNEVWVEASKVRRRKIDRRW